VTDKKWSGERAVDKGAQRRIKNGMNSEQAHRESANVVRQQERIRQDKKEGK